MVDEFEAAGMKFVGRDTDNERMEIMELSGHPFYVAVQYHPEYLSRPMKPSAPYLGLILAATDKLQSFLSMVSLIFLLNPVITLRKYLFPNIVSMNNFDFLTGQYISIFHRQTC